jgi:hypothetical protein
MARCRHAFLVLVAVAFLAPCKAATPLLSTTILSPITIPYNLTMKAATASLLLNDTSFTGATATGAEPTQVHLAPAGENSMYVMWATGSATTGPGELTPNDCSTTSSVVKYGTSASALTSQAMGTCEVYNQIYNTSDAYQGGGDGGTPALNYTSPLIHSTVISGLTPATQYYYQVGDGTTFSETFTFESLLPPGQTYPQDIILLADWGLSENSSSTLTHALATANASAGHSPVIYYVGDFVYADTWYANGSETNPVSGNEGIKSASWQPVWDAWQRFVQPLVSNVPMLTCVGNHEIEQQDDANNTIFASVGARWKTPYEAAGSTSQFWYSYNTGPVHGIFVSIYFDYTPGSDQWEWLYEDLRSVNRTETPWVILNIHNPIYSTDTSYKQFEQFRVSVEEFTYQYGVDLWFYGHVHAYERTAPMYDWNIDPCGAVHITVGDAGNTEGLSFVGNRTTGTMQYEDLNGGCPNITSTEERASFLVPANPTVVDPWSYYKAVLTFQADGNSTGIPGTNPPGYCYAQQPAWSQYREPAFGHGFLQVENATHALWSWNRNEDSVAVAADQIYIIRDPTSCPNKAGNADVAPEYFSTSASSRKMI